MLKQSLLISMLFAAISCGQNKNSAIPEVANDSSGLTSTNNPDTANLKERKESLNPDLKNLSSDLSQFIPENYTMLDTASGNLDLDQYPDMILVLKKNGEDSTSDVVDHPEKRPLLILLGQQDKSYKLAARSDNAVYCVDCGGMMGDPFQGLTIKNGYFSIQHYGGSGWRWTRIITFKYSAADNYWYLHKDGGESFHASEPEKATTKVRTVKDFGKVSFDRFDIYKED
jgi:hypothetical protein